MRRCVGSSRPPSSPWHSPSSPWRCPCRSSRPCRPPDRGPPSGSGQPGRWHCPARTIENMPGEGRTDDSCSPSRSILCARRRRSGGTMAVIDDVRSLGSELERSYPVYVRGRLKFRVGQIVYVAFSLDETVMGFAFPKEEREALVGSQPRTFQLPTASDMRFNWVHADLAALDPTEARQLVVDAWRLVVPEKVSGAYDLSHLL